MNNNTQNNTPKPNQNIENIQKTPNLNQVVVSRLKKSEKLTNILPLQNEAKQSIEKKTSGAVPNINNFLNNIHEFSTESPKLNKNLLHEKNRKNFNVNNIQLENIEKQKKKNQRIFSISILEKVEELSKVDNNIMQNE